MPNELNSLPPRDSSEARNMQNVNNLLLGIRSRIDFNKDTKRLSTITATIKAVSQSFEAIANANHILTTEQHQNLHELHKEFKLLKKEELKATAYAKCTGISGFFKKIALSLGFFDKKIEAEAQASIDRITKIKELDEKIQKLRPADAELQELVDRYTNLKEDWLTGGPTTQQDMQNIQRQLQLFLKNKEKMKLLDAIIAKANKTDDSETIERLENLMKNAHALENLISLKTPPKTHPDFLPKKE